MNYKHGLYLIPHFCVDCGKKVSSYRTKRCIPCSKKEVWQRPDYKDKMKKIHSGRVPWNKGKKFSKEIIKNMRKAQSKLKRWVGEKNPNWNGGFCRASKSHYNNYKYKLWRRAVFERDDYTCQECAVRNGNGKTVYLTAHHIKSWTKSPAVRFNVSNGIVLCEECHSQTDNYKGRGKL